MVDPITFEALMAMLQMRHDGTDPDGSERLSAPDQPEPADRVFGGLLLAQAIVAAAHRLPVELRPLTLQAEFLEGVPTTGRNAWQVRSLQDAPTMVSRRSSLHAEDGRVLFTALVRLGTVREDLPSYSTVQPQRAPNPETLPTLSERFGGDERIPAWWRLDRPVDLRHAQTPSYLEMVGPARSHQTVWWRARGEVRDDPLHSAAVMAYATDMSIMEPAFLMQESARHLGSSRILSLTHALVFHATPDLTGWVQMDCEVPTLAHGRALGRAELHADGVHAATASQLALVKFGRAED